MHFYCLSGLDGAAIAERGGDADCSYDAVLRAYLPLLKQRGAVQEINLIDDAFLSDCRARLERGERCILFAFAPPDRVPLDLPCQVVPVFAWEYSSIPSREFIDSPRDDWRERLLHFGQALTHSSYAQTVIRREVAPEFNVGNIPAPLWDRFESMRNAVPGRSAVKHQRITLGTAIVDSREFNITTETIFPSTHITRKIGDIPADLAGNRRRIEVDFGQGSSDVMMIGFYPSEGWGSWSRSASPWIILPSEVSGRITLQLEANAYGRNVGREVRMRVGEHSIVLDLGSELARQVFEVDVRQPSNFICFENLDLTQDRKADDPRTIGIGLAKLTIESSEEARADASNEAHGSAIEHGIDLEGVVYTSIFNPRDGRNDLEDILTAFCLALGERADATLILNMTHEDMPGYLDEIFALFCQLHPFQCRIIVAHNFLSEEEYELLSCCTSYVVNASRSEGQCLPLMEYMSSGIPAIAPDNTAMADYITAGNAFIVSSTPEPHYWPGDPQQRFATLRYRPSWESLRDAFLESFRVATQDTRRYGAMSEDAWRSLYGFCSMDVALERLDRFLDTMVKG